MKNKQPRPCLLALMLGVFVAVLSSTAQAGIRDSAPPMDSQTQFSQSQPQQDQTTPARRGTRIELHGVGMFPSQSSQFATGRGAMVILTREFSDQYAFEIMAGGYNQDIKTDNLSQGTMTVIPFTIGLRWQGTTDPQFVPYLGAGGGFMKISHTLDPSVKAFAASYGVNYDETVNNTSAVYLSAGFNSYTNPQKNFAFSLDLKYWHANATGEAHGTNVFTGRSATVTDTINVGGLMAGFGISYLFN
jgi:outer membrane protein W